MHTGRVYSLPMKTQRVHVILPVVEAQWLAEQAKEINDQIKLLRLRKKVGRVTRSFLMREGARLFVRDLLVQIEKAKKGNLHGKHRKMQ